MKKGVKLIGVFLFVIFTQVALGQTDKEKALALEKGMEAIKLIDNGKIDESIILLKEAQKLDPERLDYPYEIAYAYYLQGNYKKASKILKKNMNHKDAGERLFQLLGNSYDMLGKTSKAFDAYDAGLVKFPKSGIILLEKGNVYWMQKNYEKALSFYEKGIEVDPKFPSNYYRATLIYLSSTEEVWGMIYGEFFMNLERNSKRTPEISKLLYDTYKSQIKFTSDTSFSVSFSQNSVIDFSASKSNEFKLPFGIGAYEPTLMMAMLTEKSIDLNSLNTIRTNFVEKYFEGENDKKYPNVLFQFQKKVKEAGHFEAYNYWILMKGEEDGFTAWYDENTEKWDAFVTWFTANGLQLDENNKFFSGQY